MWRIVTWWTAFSICNDNCMTDRLTQKVCIHEGAHPGPDPPNKLVRNWEQVCRRSPNRIWCLSGRVGGPSGAVNLLVYELFFWYKNSSSGNIWYSSLRRHSTFKYDFSKFVAYIGMFFESLWNVSGNSIHPHVFHWRCYVVPFYTIRGGMNYYSMYSIMRFSCSCRIRFNSIIHVNRHMAS